jgi:putative ABC transport system permease protein
MRGADGKLAVSPELLLSVNLPRKSDGNLSALSIRGLTPDFATVRPEVKITDGRMFATGVHEIIVGKSARDQFAHLDIGDTAKFHNGEWKVAGYFTSNGDVHESEAIGDATTLMSAAQRTVFSGVTVTLESPEAFDRSGRAEARPTLKVACSAKPILRRNRNRSPRCSKSSRPRSVQSWRSARCSVR